MKYNISFRKPDQTESDDKEDFITFETLKENMIEDAKNQASEANKTPEAVEKKIRDDLERNELEFPRLSDLFLLISIETFKYLRDYKEDKDKLEKGYSILLDLIYETQKLRPIIFIQNQQITKSQAWELQDRETQTQHLFENQKKLNFALDHYVRQIELLRTLSFRKKTINLSFISIIIALLSVLSSVLLFILGIFFNLIG